MIRKFAFTLSPCQLSPPRPPFEPQLELRGVPLSSQQLSQSFHLDHDRVRSQGTRLVSR